jgi:coenzyme F420 hydrogenase subunit beta
MDACPGVGMNLLEAAKANFNADNAMTDKYVGHYLKCFTGYSNDQDIRYHSASGGMVCQFLIWLLETKQIDGAVVTRFNKEKDLLVESFIATTREEIIAARSSKYAPVSLHGTATAIKQAEGSRYVVVGLPCHLQGFSKLMAIDRKLREKVVGLFGIYCSSGRSFYLTEHVFKERGIQPERLTYFQYRDEGCLGSMVARVRMEKGIRKNNISETFLYNKDEVYKERYQKYYHPLRSFFIPKRCLFCIDHFAEMGDISFGDIHIQPYIQDKIGVNSLVVRSCEWLDLLRECARQGVVTLDEISVDTLNDSQKMAKKKKGRNARFIALNKRFGGKTPEYDSLNDAKFGLHDVLDWAQNRAQQFLGSHKSLWGIVTKLKKDTSKLE